MSDDAADFVVVGSGAAGASAALTLAEAGRDVLVLEEGPDVRDEDRGLGPHEAFMRLFRDRGTQVAMGRSVIPMLQGRCVGGTTVVNGAIVWRLPQDAYDRVFRAIGAEHALPLAALEARMGSASSAISPWPPPRSASPRQQQRHDDEAWSGEARLEGARHPPQRRRLPGAVAAASRRAPRSASRAWR